MLSKSKLQSIILSSRLIEAEEFYKNVLGLYLKDRSEGALVFDVNGSDLRIAPIPETTPSEHTVMGFAVSDVKETIALLVGQGIELVRWEGFPHGENGVLTTPDGSKVAWFRDPDRNILSVVQFSQS